MRALPVDLRQKVLNREEHWVKLGKELASRLGDRDKERQLRNIQSVAESSACWEAVEVFIRYQAARKQLRLEWAKWAVDKLGALEQEARGLLDRPDDDAVRRLHLDLVARTLGYAVRWHVAREEERKARTAAPSAQAGRGAAPAAGQNRPQEGRR